MRMQPVIKIALLPMLALTACTPMNERDGLIGAEPGALPDLRGDRAEVGVMGSEPSSASTLQGLDRRHWQMVVLRNPPGQVEHQPHYFEPAVIATGPARNEKLAPTEATVLDGASDGGSLLAEAVLAPFVFAGELLILPVRAIIDPPWSVHRSPDALPPSPAQMQPTDWRWVGASQ